MPNIKIGIEYDGTNYCGWQVQNSHHATTSPRHKKKSIQEVIEKTLRKILQEEIHTIVSGRTDAGVHALGQVANFKTKSQIPLRKLQWAMNSLLPEDISIVGIEKVPLGFHSRFDAKSKVYRYSILNRPYPCALAKNTAYFFPHHLNLKLMQSEARVLLGKHDFKSFQASDKRERASIKTIQSIKVRKQRDYIYIDIQADGFLYNMARNIAGTLLEIGRGRFKRGDLKIILQRRNRKLSGPTLAAKGLTLVRVEYP